MTSRRSVIINCVVSVLLIGASVGGFTWLGEREAPERRGPPKSAGVAVITQPVARHNGPIHITSHGVVVPFRELRLAAEVRGRVVRQSENLRSGNSVKAGDVLVEIDPTDYQLEVRRLEALRAQTQAEYDSLSVSIENNAKLLELAKTEQSLRAAELARLEGLVQTGAATKSDIDDARREEVVARGAVVRIENTVRDLQADQKLTSEKLNLTSIELEQAELNQRRTVIRSPVDGRIVQSMIEEQGFVEVGQPFAILEDTSTVEVRSNLTTEEMLWIWQDDIGSNQDEAAEEFSPYKRKIPATVSFVAGDQEYQWQASFHRVEGTGIDQRTRTLPCLFRVDRPREMVQVGQGVAQRVEGPDSLMRGMFVTVAMSCLPQQELFQVPAEAIRPGGKLWLSANGKLQVLGIKVVSRMADVAVVESPYLKEGQLAIVSPVAGARDGLLLQSGRKAGGKGKPPEGAAREGRQAASSRESEAGLRAAQNDAKSGGRP